MSLRQLLLLFFKPSSCTCSQFFKTVNCDSNYDVYFPFVQETEFCSTVHLSASLVGFSPTAVIYFSEEYPLRVNTDIGILYCICALLCVPSFLFTQLCSVPEAFSSIYCVYLSSITLHSIGKPNPDTF